MSGRLGNYLELVREAQNRRLEITRSQKRQIAELYLESAREFERAAKKYSEKTLTYRWLKDYAASLKKQSDTMLNALQGITTQSILGTAEAVTKAERRFYTKACPALSERFSDVFSRIPHGVAEELMSGKIYQGFSGLSERLWNYQREYERDIQTIINRGIIQHKSAYDLAKDLELYLKPGAAKPWNWGIVYPGTKRVVDYNAQRLARTAVTHAYQLSLQRATRDNPFVEGYQWHSSNGGRVCPLCASRDGQIFAKDSLPLDHPNGMCVVTAEITKSYREIGEELGAWARGENRDPALDRWLNPVPDRDTIDLTPDEEYALMDYISSGSYKLNDPLRRGAALTPEQIKLMNNLDSALSKMPIYRGTVYRSLSDFEIDDVASFISGHIVGSQKMYKAYLSTGTEVYDESMPIQYVIISKNGRDIRMFNPEESEILFPRNTIFYVEKTEGNTIYLREA